VPSVVGADLGPKTETDIVRVVTTAV